MPHLAFDLRQPAMHERRSLLKILPELLYSSIQEWWEVYRPLNAETKTRGFFLDFCLEAVAGEVKARLDGVEETLPRRMADTCDFRALRASVWKELHTTLDMTWRWAMATPYSDRCPPPTWFFPENGYAPN